MSRRAPRCALSAKPVTIDPHCARRCVALSQAKQQPSPHLQPDHIAVGAVQHFDHLWVGKDGGQRGACRERRDGGIRALVAVHFPDARHGP